MVQIRQSGENFTIRALIDSASKRSFLTNKIVKRLGVKTQTSNFQISGLGGAVVANSDKICNITLCAKEDFNLEAQVIVVRNLTSLLPSRSIPVNDLTDLKYLNLADPGFLVSSQVDMLLGSDIIPYIMLEGTRKQVLGNLVAQNSVFGWYIYGPINIHNMSLATLNIVPKNDEDISTLLRKFWEQEEVSKTVISSESDLYCENLYKKTTCRRPDGRYVVKLPFKTEYPNLMFLESSRLIQKGNTSIWS